MHKCTKEKYHVYIAIAAKYVYTAHAYMFHISHQRLGNPRPWAAYPRPSVDVSFNITISQLMSEFAMERHDVVSLNILY